MPRFGRLSRGQDKKLKTMELRHKSDLQDRLAAEYVLGTLRGSARVRFQRMLREDASLRFAVEAWQSRLMPMAAAVDPVQPPGRVWKEIASRISVPANGAMSATGGLWNSLAFWRSLGVMASGAAAALLAAVVVFAPEAPVPAPPPQIVRVPSRDMQASYVAVLSDPRTQKPVLLAAALRDSDQLVIKRLDDSIVVMDKSLELWALPPGQAPRSLGLVASEAKQMLKLVAVADQSLGGVPALAVSLEPPGGSRTGAPTGPVLYAGPCVKSW